LLLIPAANHVYRATDTDDRLAQLKLYTDPTIPVVPELATGIVHWIARLK
jgi:hypothetical protein